MKFSNFSLVAMSLISVATLFSCSNEVTHFATTDMTWAEFYAGELGAPASELEANGYDAVTSATMQKTKRYSQCIVSEDGSQIIGVKNVAVGMTNSVYKKLSQEQKARYTFLNDTTITVYKTLAKDGSFGHYLYNVVTPENVTTSISSTSPWGNYVVGVRGADLKGSILGVVLTDNEGGKYGLKPLENIWFNAGELGFCVAEFTEPRGNHPSYKNTKNLEGKTITSVTYIMDGADAIYIETDLLVKKQNGAKLTVGEAQGKKDVKVSIEGVPEGYALTKVSTRVGREMKVLTEEEYTFADGVLTLNGTPTPGMYTILFENDEYVDLQASVGVDMESVSRNMPPMQRR